MLWPRHARQRHSQPARAHPEQPVGQSMSCLGYKGKVVQRFGIAHHAVKAFECYKRAARNSIPAAWAALGLCYEAGIGVEEDIEEAVKLYKKAAEKSDPFAMAHYGYALANGEGIEKDEKAAMSWLIKAAMKGDMGAIHILKEDYNYELR